MFKVGDYLVHRKDVCEVKDKKNDASGKEMYVLIPINDDSLKIKVPSNSIYIRKLITKEEIDELISNIPKTKKIESDERFIENEYRKLLSTGKHEDLIKIIRTTYLRNKERQENNKKIGEKDNNYFKLAEKYLYTEVAMSLDISYDEAKKYIIDKVELLNK